MVALHFPPAVLHRAAGAARRLQLLGELLERRRVHGQAANHCDGFAAAPFGFARDTNDTVRRRGCRRGVTADTLRDRLAATGAHPARVGGVDETAAGFHGWSARRAAL